LLEHRHRHRHNFWADAIAGQERDAKSLGHSRKV
jgi:hypothetical protein